MSQKPQITKEDVARIAQLARMHVTDEELEAATKDLIGILSHFAAIQDIDTTGVPTADDASGLTGVTREDIAEIETLASHDDLLDAAPEKQDRQVKVKAVF